MTQKRVAAFTMVHREPAHLQRWLEHYIYHEISPRDIYVLNHNSAGDTDGEIMRLCRDHDVNILPVCSPGIYQADWLCRTLKQFCSLLRGQGYYVVFSGVDELIFPDVGSLRGAVHDVFDNHNRLLVVAQGHELISSADDKPLVDGLPLFRQRTAIYPCSRYTKLAAVNGDIELDYGFQYRGGWTPRSFHLLHYHKADYNAALARHQRLSAVEWCTEGVNPYGHNLITEPKQLATWLRSNADDPAREAITHHAPGWMISQVIV